MVKQKGPTEREKERAYEVGIDTIKPIDWAKGMAYDVRQDVRKAQEVQNGYRYDALLDNRTAQKNIKEDKGLVAKATVWEAEVASSTYSEEFRDFVYSLSSIAWDNHGGPIHQIAQRTLRGKKDNYPYSAYFAFKTEKDAMKFRQDGIDILDKTYSGRERYNPVSGIWIREQEDIGSNVIKPVPFK